jgi:hypothetical protein
MILSILEMNSSQMKVRPSRLLQDLSVALLSTCCLVYTEAQPILLSNLDELMMMPTRYAVDLYSSDTLLTSSGTIIFDFIEQRRTDLNSKRAVVRPMSIRLDYQTMDIEDARYNPLHDFTIKCAFWTLRAERAFVGRLQVECSIKIDIAVRGLASYRNLYRSWNKILALLEVQVLARLWDDT